MVRDEISDCLEHRAAALAVTVTAGLVPLLAHRLLALPGLLGLQDRHLHALESLREASLLLHRCANPHDVLNPSVSCHLF